MKIYSIHNKINENQNHGAMPYVCSYLNLDIHKIFWMDK